MTSNVLLTIALAALAATIAFGQAAQTPPAGQPAAPARRQRSAIQPAQDAREPDVLAKCKNPPPARGGPDGPGCGAPLLAIPTIARGYNGRTK